MKTQDQIVSDVREILSWPAWRVGRADVDLGADELREIGERLGVDLTAVGSALLTTSREEFDELCARIEHGMQKGDPDAARDAVMYWIVYGMVSYMAGVLEGRELGLGGDGHIVDTPHD